MRRPDQRKFHYIYQINRDDGKYYIGCHSTDNLEDGYFGSGTLLARSIKKHGKDKHTKVILEFCETRVALRLREKEIVNTERLADQHCMNLKLGGQGGWDHITPEAIIKRAKTFSQRYEGRLPATDSAKHKISQSMQGNKSWDIFAKSNPDKAREIIMRRAQASKSLDAEIKRAKTRALRNHQQGEKNSQFGTCWVTNGIKPIKIKKEQLGEYLENGYRSGRK
jgi:hypothetical protein